MNQEKTELSKSEEWFRDRLNDYLQYGLGAFVVLADAVARTVVAPLQLPVGVLAAAVGVPTFIAMLLRRPSAPARP